MKYAGSSEHFKRTRFVRLAFNLVVFFILASVFFILSRARLGPGFYESPTWRNKHQELFPRNDGVTTYISQQGSIPDKVSWNNMSVEARFLLRKQNVLSSCGNHQQPLTDIEKEMLYKNIVVDDIHRVLYCPVPKTGSTSWRKVLLVMSGKFHTIKETDKPKLLKQSIESRLHTYDKHQQEYRLKHYTSFMVTREPLSRFVSNFKDKFSNPTLNRWRRKLCEEIVTLVTAMGKKHTTDPTNISIEEFAEYVIDLAWNASSNIYMKLNPHWRPMTVQCRPCHISYDYYSWIETMEEDAEYLLAKFNAPPELHLIWENQSPKTMVESPGARLKHYLSQLSDHQLNQLISIYKQDYEIFGYNPPG